MSSDDHRPLEISADVARAEGVPDDLDATQREPYTIPSTRRRRLAGWAYLAGAVAAGVGALAGPAAGLMVTAGLLAGLAVWHFAAAWRIEVLDPAALEKANSALDFPVGHASAVVGFDGWRARPIWNVLVFDSADPPTRRGLVRVDATDGTVIETYSEVIERPI